jgi:hypothetical protein
MDCEGLNTHLHLVPLVEWILTLTKTKNELRDLSPRANYTDRATLFGEVSVNFFDREYLMVSATDPHGRILGFLYWRLYFFFQVAPQLYSRGSVDPVPDPLLLRKSL